jgi:uncharacterized protein (TIGR02266 family)
VSDAPTVSDARRKILVVDDAPMFRELEALFLGRSGRVITARDGNEALAVARRERPDVIVTDLSMPGMDGDELCARLKADADFRNTPIVIVAGSDAGDEHERAVRAGADDVVEKPVNRVTLIQSVNRFLRLAVRGLVRVPMETDVRMGHDGRQLWAWARNLSRGGMFVEAEETLDPETELDLEFALPDVPVPLAPTAKVIWRRPPTSSTRAGLGLRFLNLDRASARQIDEFIYLRAALTTDGTDGGEPGPYMAAS